MSRYIYLEDMQQTFYNNAMSNKPLADINESSFVIAFHLCAHFDRFLIWFFFGVESRMEMFPILTQNELFLMEQQSKIQSNNVKNYIMCNAKN